MTVAFLGDSITCGYGLSDVSQRYTALLSQNLGLEEENYGITGTLIAQAGLNRTDGRDFVSRLHLIDRADIAVIFGGTNDYFWSDLPIRGGEGDAWFANAMDTICQYIQSVRAGKITLIVTPYPHNGVGNFQGGETWKTASRHDTEAVNFCGHTLSDYATVMEEACLKYGIPCLNLHKNFAFDHLLHTLDGCHPNEEGHRLLAEAIEKKLRTLLNQSRRDSMKKVVLIGDSIRMGYDKYIKASLEGEAEVFYPAENCRFATYVIRFVHEWKKKGEWPDDVDLVHWNAGLWDVPEIMGDEPVTPVEAYAHTIARIDKRLRQLFPNAKMVFATSTAVQEEKYKGVFKRHNCVIEQYNEAAIRALADTDTVIDDLYAVTTGCPDECHSDMTHYSTPAGIERVGGQVLSVISRELEITPVNVNIMDFTPEKYTKSNIGN